MGSSQIRPMVPTVQKAVVNLLVPVFIRDSRGHPRCPMLPSALGSWGQGDIVNMQVVIGLKAMFGQPCAICLVAACARVLPHAIATNSRGSAGVDVSSSLRLNVVPPSHAGPARRVQFLNALNALPWFVAVMGLRSRECPRSQRQWVHLGWVLVLIMILSPGTGFCSTANESVGANIGAWSLV